ncbi:MAG: ABC transporter permease [Bacteroidota bacterium]|nr:ABC transporter permease [Bacteroidota bacterium]
MKQVLRLFNNSYRIFFNDRVAVMLTFIVPMVLMYLFGAIFGSADSGPDRMPIAVLNQSNSPVAQQVVATLDTMKAFRVIKTYKDKQGRQVAFDSVTIKRFAQTGGAAAAVVLPPDAFTDTSLGLKMKFYYDPKNEIEFQVVQGLIKQVAYNQIPAIINQSMQRQSEKYLGTKSGQAFNRGIASLVSKYFHVDTSLIMNPSKAMANWMNTSTSSVQDSSKKGGTNFFENMVKIESQQVVGEQLKNPWATRSVGGWAMTFLLFTITASSASLFDEKKSGVMLRLLVSPVSRVHILWSKYFFNMSLGIIQLFFMFFVGWVMFDVDVFSNVVNLLLIILAASVACTSFGMLLAAFAQTRQQAQGLGTLLILSMSAVGGAWFPTSFMPPTIQSISKLTFVYWSMDGFLEVLWRGSGIAAIAPHLLILFGMGSVISAVSVWGFKRGKVFE